MLESPVIPTFIVFIFLRTGFTEIENPLPRLKYAPERSV